MPSLPMKQQAQIVLFKRGGREGIADLAGKGWSKYSERHGPVLASVSDKKQKPYGSSVLKIKWKCTFYLVDVYTTSPPVCVCVVEIVWDHPWGDLLEEVEHGMIILCSLSSSATGSVLIDSLSFPSCRFTWASFEKGLDHFTFLSYRHASVVRNNRLSTPRWRYMYILKLRERENFSSPDLGCNLGRLSIRWGNAIVS